LIHLFCIMRKILLFCNNKFIEMNNQNSKGNRLNWTSLKEVKPVSLTENSTKGRRLTEKILKERQSTTSGKLVP
jgi:hypothetical protein